MGCESVELGGRSYSARPLGSRVEARTQQFPANATGRAVALIASKGLPSAGNFWVL